MLVALALAACTNGLGGHQRDDGASRWSEGGSSTPSHAEEAEARRRIARAIEAAEELSRQPGLPEDERARLKSAIASARDALVHYDRLRLQGQANVAIMAGLGTAASGIVANDATVVGVADDWMLVVIAIGAMATEILAESPASSDELVTAWRGVGYRLQELSVAMDTAVALAAPGNQADTGIMQEVYALLESMGLSAQAEENICKALAILYNQAKSRRDNKRISRIRKTQKDQQCRPSRHTRE